jgi:hypothetical protein
MASNDKSSSSGSNTDSDSEHTCDSGYNSDLSDTEAEYLKQRQAQHESAGPALSDPCKSTRKIISTEKKK